MLSRKRGVFAPTDGVCALMAETEAWAARGANFSDPSLLDEEGRLAFRSLMLREDDVALAEAAGAELSRKLEVRAGPLVRASGLYAVGGRLYEATRAEESGRLAYLHLSEVACDGTATLVAESDSYDALRQRRAAEAPAEVFCRRASPALARSAAGGSSRLAPSLTLTLRASDYAGEAVAERDGARYAVAAARGSGRWVALDLVQLAGARR